MRVLINKKVRGRSHSFMLKFGDRVTVKDLKKIVNNKNEDITMRRLVKKSIAMVEVPPKERHKAKMIADFVVSDHYTAERLG